jgi:type II secretory pathway pseudopilin PulG
MDSTTIIQIAAGIVFLAVLVVYISFLASLSSALGKCSRISRTMEPGLVWLMLIPLFNLIWQFLVVIALSNSLRNEFRARGVSNIEPEPGKSIGIALSICAACGIVPFVNFVAFPVQLILLVVYWSKIAGFSRMLDQVPAPNVTAPYTPQDLPPNMPFAQPGTVWAPPPPNLDTRRRVPVFVWILVGFAGFIPIVAILMLIAIPTVGSLKKKANDLSAQQAIRAIHEAEIQYQSTYPSSGFACTLPALGGQPASGAPSPVAAHGPIRQLHSNGGSADCRQNRRPRLLQRRRRSHQLRSRGRYQLHRAPSSVNQATLFSIQEKDYDYQEGVPWQSRRQKQKSIGQPVS